jgi:hypothetical protein
MRRPMFRPCVSTKKPVSHRGPSRGISTLFLVHPCLSRPYAAAAIFLRAAWRLLRIEQDRLAKELKAIGAALAAFGKAYGKGKSSRKLFKSARARIASSQRARWAKIRAESVKLDKVVTTHGKRTRSHSVPTRAALYERDRTHAAGRRCDDHCTKAGVRTISSLFVPFRFRYNVNLN